MCLGTLAATGGVGLLMPEGLPAQRSGSQPRLWMTAAPAPAAASLGPTRRRPGYHSEWLQVFSRYGAACVLQRRASNGETAFSTGGWLMSVDISAQLIQANVLGEQAPPNGSHIIGAGFLVIDPAPDGKPRTVLVTANHVLNRMTGTEA